MPHKIKVYCDLGVSQQCYEALICSLKSSPICSEFEICEIDAHAINETDWQNDCQLLIIPGGRDIPYQDKLGNTGTNRIRRYVQKGGRYLGICAGAYFASAEIVFEENQKHEVLAKRQLQFFPGRAIGTIYGDTPFCYLSDSSIYAASVNYNGQSLHTFYNGGCYFEKADTYRENVKVLAKYQDAKIADAPAIILCHDHHGKALLSGVHFEMEAKFVGEVNKVVSNKLAKDEKLRKELFEKIMGLILP